MIGVAFTATAVLLALAACTARSDPTVNPGAESSASVSAAPTTPDATPTQQRRQLADPNGMQRCHSNGLTADVVGGGAGMGHRYAALGLTNQTSTACRISGFPVLQLLAPDGTALPTTVLQDGPAATPIAVGPGQTVWAALRWSVVESDDEAANHCAPNPGWLQVTPPDESTALRAAFTGTVVCQHGRISVGAYLPDRPADG